MSPRSASDTSLERLRALLLAEGGLMAGLVAPPAGKGDGPTGASAVLDPAADPALVPHIAQIAAVPDPVPATAQNHAPAADAPAPGPAQIAASGPRAAAHREDYELLIEAIYEGYLLHYGTPRVAVTEEADLGLLAGDRLYALGLARLVALGDTEAVVELADTITLSALAQGAGAPELADAVWAAGARALGWGSSDAHRRAKDLTRAGGAEAIEAMRTSATGLSASP
jgi:hypothetical protein